MSRPSGGAFVSVFIHVIFDVTTLPLVYHLGNKLIIIRAGYRYRRPYRFFTGIFGLYRFFVPVYRAVSYSTSCWVLLTNPDHNKCALAVDNDVRGCAIWIKKMGGWFVECKAGGERERERGGKTGERENETQKYEQLNTFFLIFVRHDFCVWTRQLCPLRYVPVQLAVPVQRTTSPGRRYYR